ncbi:MAG: hypothetical protein JOZ47_03985 [Kutzneria sp.]|nr:hypothetical protein [Kutzneria sp.]
MTGRKLTPAQVTLLRAVAEGHVDRLGACAYYATIDGRQRQVTERVRTLDEAGLVNPFGVAIKHGKPMSPNERFPDYHQVTLTTAGQHALASVAT